MPDYKLAARRAARKYGVNEGIFLAMIQQESGFRPGVSSPAGAQGIAQFIPSTAKAYGVNLGDGKVTDDLEGAARYLRDNLKRTKGNYSEALSIYNSGRPQGYKSIPETINYVRNIRAMAKRYGASSTPSTPTSSSSPQTRTVTTPGVDRSAERQQLKMQYLLNRQDPNALLMLKQGLDQAQDTPSQTTQVRTGGSGSVGASGGVRGASTGITEAARREAQRINDARVPYQWGGGHGGRQARGSKVTPLDCSGAVSRVLGIDPRVASQFKSFGSPGRAPGGKGITIYAKDDHVLMEINGHLFGTSRSNPGGGAGWVKRSELPAGYLSRFTARHLANS